MKVLSPRRVLAVSLLGMSFSLTNAFAGQAVMVCEPGFNGAICELFISGGNLQSTSWTTTGSLRIVQSAGFFADVACNSQIRGGLLTAVVTFADGTQDTEKRFISCDYF